MRRTPAVGSPMLVQLPETREFWKDTGEGGLSFWLHIPEERREVRRNITCSGGGFYWDQQDVSFPAVGKRYLDGGLLIGSMGESLWSEDLGEYYQATPETLTPQGLALY